MLFQNIAHYNLYLHSSPACACIFRHSLSLSECQGTEIAFNKEAMISLAAL
jgi:hypothetical protein